jgi:fructose-bisphosphate aldolase class II
MKYESIGLSNTNHMLRAALSGGYAVPAFNFNNMESLQAILGACGDTKSPVILQASRSAIKYMGLDTMIGMISGAIKAMRDRAPWSCDAIALHLDHGPDFDVCRECMDAGFSSVMIDGSTLPFDENAALTKRVAEYARKRGVSVEAELGALAGVEDEVGGGASHYTDPADAVRFVRETGVDSLAVSIGTSHGAYKMKSPSDSLRFDILAEIAAALPDFPLVLHGASSVPREIVAEINEYGGSVKSARGIPPEQLRRAVGMNICKINVDSDSRLAFTAAVRAELARAPENFDPRKYLSAARDKMTELYKNEIKDIMNSANRCPE